MKITHFIEYVDPQACRFIEAVAAAVPGEHVVLSRDPHAFNRWKLPSGIEVFKRMTLWGDTFLKFEPDAVIDYIGETAHYGGKPPELIVQVRHNAPPGAGLSTVGVQVKQMTVKDVSVSPPRVIDLGDFEQPIDGELAVYFDKDEQHDLSRIIEAMAKGIPVVANRTSKTSNVIATGVTGLLGLTDSIVQEALAYLRHDPETRRELGVAARHWVEENADIQVAVTEVKRLLTGVRVDADNPRAIGRPRCSH